MTEKANHDKSESDWAKELPPESFRVLRQCGTEAPFSGKYCNHSEIGTYICTGCAVPLFSSDAKFNSGCGWPSFFTTLPEPYANVEEREDLSLGMIRVEILCKSCGGHLGHVFTDGPEPTGLRYCVNSVSLKFAPANFAANKLIVK